MASNYLSNANENNARLPRCFKMILIGNANVGKTSLIVRYNEGYFHDTTTHKILQKDFVEKYVQVKDVSYRIAIWDTAGQEKYRSVTRSLYRNLDGVMFVYDVTSPSSYVELKSWVKEVRDNSDNFDPDKCFFLANKSDLDWSLHKIPFTQLQNDPDFSEFHNKFETSALSGRNVNSAFTKLTNEIAKRSSLRVVDEQYTSIIRKYDTGEPTGCAC